MESVQGSNFRLNACDELLVVVGGMQPWTESSWNEQLRAICSVASLTPKRAVLIYSPCDLPESARDWLRDWPSNAARLAIVADSGQGPTAAIFWSLSGAVQARAFDPSELPAACQWLNGVARFEPMRVYQQIESALWRNTAATATARLALSGR